MGGRFYHARGHCPVCERATTFRANDTWLREHLVCAHCRSVPRERAMALILEQRFPDWRSLAIHESSPVSRGISLKLARECRHYVASHFFRDHPLGATFKGFRNENLEQQTFADESFDLVVSLDVMEHVNRPAVVIKEIWRTLKPGGTYIFSTPTDKATIKTLQRARYTTRGVEVLIEPALYHGNPISSDGSLVTFDYGYDLPALIGEWSSFDTTVMRFHDRGHGILGEATEIYVCAKP